MAPLDWTRLMQLSADDITQDTDKADDMYEVLAEFDPGGEEDVARLKKLLEVTHALMVIKGTEAQFAGEELADVAATEGKSTAKRDQEIEDLKREIEALNREIKDVKRFGPSEAGAGRGEQARFLRDELNTMESQVAQLNKDLKEKEKSLREEKETSERYYQRATDSEQELRELRRENDRLSDDVRDYQRQLESQREALVNRRDDETDQRDKITQKNKILVAALEENRNLAEHNVELEDKIEKLKLEMREGQREIDATTDKCMQLRQVADDADKMVSRMTREIDILKTKVEELTEQARSKTDADDEIMAQLNNEVEKWREILDEKNEHIMDLEVQITQLRDRLTAANMDSEKQSISMLNKALEEKEKTIEKLRKQLDDASYALDENTALIEDVRTDMMKTGKGPVDRQQQRIIHMQNTLRMHEEQLKDAESRAAQAEDDARAKDKHLSEALERMRQYETGEYGLAEAVSEIKNHKHQINLRDRNIEELTQYINKCEMQLNDLYDETEDLRERLGLDRKEPLDLTQYRKKKGLRVEEERALNRVLTKEVENLEEERIMLKQQIRKLAQATGQKAVALGLTADDMMEVDRFIGDLKEKRAIEDTKERLRSDADRDQLKIKNIQLDAEVEMKVKRLDKVSSDNAELKARNDELEEENRNLERGLREYCDALRQRGSTADGEVCVIECPTLERMLAAIDAKNLIGRADTSLFLKAQVDNLTGHVEELRSELKNARFEATKATVNFDKATEKMENLETELKNLREMGAGALLQTIHLPEGMAITSSDVIASLNEHLVHVLQELSLKEEMVLKMETGLENYRRKFAVIRHQQSLLYQDYVKDKKEWEEAQKRMEDEMSKLHGNRDEDKVRIQEFDRLTDTLSQDDVEVRRRLADMTRKITVLRVNEKALTRRYSAMQDIEGKLRKDLNRMRNDMMNMETAVSERLGYLQRHKDMAAFKISALQKALDDCVPAHELDLANQQFTEVTEKYRDLLEQSNSMVVKTEQSSGFELEMKHLQDENNSMRRDLEIEREKLHTLEVAFEQMRKKGLASSQTLTDSDVISISRKLTTLEMKELNERQRAEHATRMYEQQKQTLRSVEDRNFELEQKFSELTRMNLEQQKVERELRDELANCVVKSVSDADRRKITELEAINIKLQDESSRLKDISEVASTQVRAIEAMQQSRDKEVTSLRQQLIDFQAQSDEKTVIGKLHRHIVHLQVSEGTAVRKLEDAMKKIIKLEAHILNSERKIDQKDQTIYHNRLESRSKTKYLKHTIQDFRRKYAGSVPLRQQERFAQSLIELQEEKKNMAEELRQTHEDRLRMEDKLAEAELHHTGLQELIATLKDGRGAQKVTEWHAKMEAVRLEDLKFKRDIERLKYQVKFLEGINKKHEAEVLSLEENKVRMTREFEDRELEWERREVELERIIYNMEQQQSAIAGAASQFEEAAGVLPDPNWPVPRQLEHAVDTIKKNVKLILDGKAQVEHHKKRADELEKEVRDREREVIARDKAILELRLRMPATADRDEMVLKVTSKALHSKGPLDEVEDYESQQAVRVAQSTVHSLQARLRQKEETLQKFQDLLQQARDELVSMNKRHEEELRVLNEKLHSKSDDAFTRFKHAVSDSMRKQGSTIPTNDQLRRLNELEDMVAEQDNSMAALRDKLIKARQDTVEWRYKNDDILRQHASEKDRLIEDHRSIQADLEHRALDLEHQLGDKDKALSMMTAEVETQKEINTRAPTTTMKDLITRLRNQLALKEKQHKALSKALLEMRADMVQQASDDVKANTDQIASQQNVHRIVEKHTKDLHDNIQELECQNTKMKKELKKKRDREQSHNVEIEEFRQDLSKRENQVRHLKEDKARLEDEVEDLEKKIERMGTMQKQKGPSEAVQHEVEDLRRKIRILQEMKHSKHQAEKPYEQQVKETPQQQEQAVARWEESKKWQKMTDRLKTRLKDKEQEIERITKSHDLAKNALERANKDKELLEHKLRSTTRGGADEPVIKAVHVQQAAATPGGQMAHSTQELKRKIHDLEDENTNLRRQLTMTHDKAHEEVMMRNTFLTERLQQLENQLSKRLSSSKDGSVAPGSEAYRELLHKEQEMEKKMIRMSEENIELRFEVEQAKKDIPRLKDRIADQQKYIEILKVEKDQLLEVQTIRSHSSIGSSLGSLSANIRRIGESGRSTRDLEKTIALLKKVVERTQAENEQLKKAPGVISNEQHKTLQLENRGLKDQLEEMRQKIGAGLSERYQSQQAGTAKIMADYDKLRRDLMKEMETNEKLRIKLKQQEITNEQLQNKLTNTKEKLLSESSRQPSLGSLDRKEWKGVVVGKMSEEKIEVLEEDVERKNKMLSDVKILLREAAQREQQLLQKNTKLEKMILVLENCPPGAKVSDAELMKEFQHARLKIDRLENEKKELEYAVELLRKQVNPAGGEVDLEHDEVLNKAISHDKIFSDMVEIRAQLKAVELERDQFAEQVKKLTIELENFGPDFFDEIEDLRFQYHEAIQRNANYEEQLSQLSKQFGVSVNIPGL